MIHHLIQIKLVQILENFQNRMLPSYMQIYKTQWYYILGLNIEKNDQ